jgi:hypothetical protein
VLATLCPKVRAAPADIPEIFCKFGPNKHDGTLVIDAGAFLTTIPRRVTKARVDCVTHRGAPGADFHQPLQHKNAHRAVTDLPDAPN